MLTLLLYKTPEQLSKHCQTLNNKQKQALYQRILDEIKKVKDIKKLKKLSKVAVAVEEVMDEKLLEQCDSPLRNTDIVFYNPYSDEQEIVNYVFSIGNSLRLYDLQEDRDKALYYAIRSNDVEIVKTIISVLLPQDILSDSNDIGFHYLLEHMREINNLLSEPYEELKPSLSEDMKNFIEKQLRFYLFLYNNIHIMNLFLEAEKVIKEMGAIGLFEAIEKRKCAVYYLIELLADKSELDYRIEGYILNLIANNIKVLGEQTEQKKKLESNLDTLIDLMTKYERCEVLEYEIRRLESDKYPNQASIEERKNEMKEKYVDISILVAKREELLKQLDEFSDVLNNSPLW